MGYNVGDKVVIKSLNRFIHCGARNEFMDKYCGRTATIVYKACGYYKLDIDNLDWIWTDDMFENNNIEMFLPDTTQVRGILAPNACFAGTFRLTESTKKKHPIELIGEHKFLTLKVKS